MARTDKRVTAVIIRNSKLLLDHRFREGSEYWVFPGGGVEEGETWEDGLQREILEETGLELLGFQFLYDSTENPGCRFYACQLAPGEPMLGGPERAEQSPDNQHILEWVEIEKVPQLKPIFPIPDFELIFN